MAVFFKFIKNQLLLTLPDLSNDFTGKTIIVTGSNVGLGLEASRHLVRLNAAKVILGVRNVEKGERAKKEIEESTQRLNVVEVWQVDLSSYESVKQFAKKVEGLARLDAVIENAGIAVNVYKTSEDNESTITTNVVSTFLLGLLVLPKLRQTAVQFNVTPHLVIVSSEVHELTDMPERRSSNIFEALNDPKTARMSDRYNVSKLLEVFYCREMASQSQQNGKPSVIINYLNPGFCHSELTRDSGWGMRILKFFLARTTEAGSRTLVVAADAGSESHGEYMSNCRVEAPSSFVRSTEGVQVQKRVYQQLSEKLEKIAPGIMANV